MPTCFAPSSVQQKFQFFLPIGIALSERSKWFVSIGTSGSVYPAAGFVSEARGHGIATCEINLEPSDNARQFDHGRYGLASEVVPKWVDEMLAST